MSNDNSLKIDILLLLLIYVQTIHYFLLHTFILSRYIIFFYYLSFSSQTINLCAISVSLCCLYTSPPPFLCLYIRISFIHFISPFIFISLLFIFDSTIVIATLTDCFYYDSDSSALLVKIIHRLQTNY